MREPKDKLAGPGPRWDMCDTPRALLAAQEQRKGQKTNGWTDKSLHQFTNILV